MREETEERRRGGGSENRKIKDDYRKRGAGRVMGRNGCVLFRDGVKYYLMYHNAMRILGWEGQDEMQAFFWGGGITIKIGGHW